MSLVSSSIPNLIGGVSQQSPSVRARNASQLEINTFHSLVQGLGKRPAAEWNAEVYTSSSSSRDASVHAFETANGSKFLLVFDIDADGNTRGSVINPELSKVYPLDLSTDNGYISSLEDLLQESLRFLTVGDTTFILNRNISPSTVPVPEDAASTDVSFNVGAAIFDALPEASSLPVGTVGRTDDGLYWIVRRTTLRSDLWNNIQINAWYPFTPSTDRSRKNPKRTASVFIRQAVHNTDYSFTVEFEDGSLQTGAYKTPKSVDTSNNPVEINTDLIVAGLMDSFNTAGSGATSAPVGSTLSIAATKDIRKITFKDGFGDQAMRAFSDSVQNFVDLPPNEIEGRVVRISGSLDTGGDDYFVEFRDGIWKETVAYGERTTLDDSTMPMTLVYDPVNDVFDLKTHEWPGRTAGDKESNPDPTFVGRTINDMFLFKGRMVFLADENVVFSETGFYENFYRTTLTQYIETDPIDVASTTAKTSVLRFGVAFDQTLIAFSDSQQFRLLSGDSLTPQNISIVPTTSFNSSRICRPITVGQNVFFTEETEQSRYASVMEYYRSPNTEQDDAASVTQAVPRYIPKGLVQMKAAANENLVVCLSKGNSGELYVYRYFWNGGSKAVSAWTQWKLANVSSILSVDFFGDILYLLVRDAESRIHILSIDVEEGKYRDNLDFNIHLDFKVNSKSVVGIYDPSTDQTRFRMPSVISDVSRLIGVVSEEYGDYPAGYIIQPESASGPLVYFPGDLTSVPMVLGYTYEKRYVFSPQFIRQRMGEGEIAIQDRRTSLRYMNVFFDETAWFSVEVTPKGRSTWGTTFTGKKFSDPSSVTDRQPVDSGHFRFACKGKADETVIALVNDSPFPSWFSHAEWEGHYTPRSQRI